MVVKPISEGSSLGVKFLKGPSKFEDVCQAIKKKYGGLFIEKYIPGKEITAGILRKDGQDIPLPLIELRTKTNFYNYKAKYTPGVTEFIIPARLNEKTEDRVKNLALKAHLALGCFGFSRVDFRVSPTEEIFALEVNTVPGMTRTSDLPQAACETGIQFDSLVEYMLKTAWEKGDLDK